MRNPSVPGDLDRLDQVWSRAAALALSTAAVGDGDEYEWADGALHCENAGGSYWWRLQTFDAGRAVLCGQDSDASHTHLADPPVDLLAGGPECLQPVVLHVVRVGRPAPRALGQVQGRGVDAAAIGALLEGLCGPADLERADGAAALALAADLGLT